MSLIWESKPKKTREPTLEERMVHQAWCFKNDIIIYFQLIDWKEGRIVVSVKGVKTVRPEIYRQHKPKPKDVKHHETVWRLYTEYYNNRNYDE